MDAACLVSISPGRGTYDIDLCSRSWDSHYREVIIHMYKFKYSYMSSIEIMLSLSFFFIKTEETKYHIDYDESIGNYMVIR